MDEILKELIKLISIFQKANHALGDDYHEQMGAENSCCMSCIGGLRHAKIHAGWWWRDEVVDMIKEVCPGLRNGEHGSSLHSLCQEGHPVVSEEEGHVEHEFLNMLNLENFFKDNT